LDFFRRSDPLCVGDVAEDEEDDENGGAATTVENEATTTQGLDRVGAAAKVTATDNVTVTATDTVTATEAAEAAKKKVVEKRLQALVAIRATRICRNMMDTGVCDQNKGDKSCQYSHPKKCIHYATYGLAKTNPNGCRSADCSTYMW
jgi:hypothetical protein